MHADTRVAPTMPSTGVRANLIYTQVLKKLSIAGHTLGREERFPTVWTGAFDRITWIIRGCEDIDTGACLEPNIDRRDPRSRP
jgi:hypothetical protein